MLSLLEMHHSASRVHTDRQPDRAVTRAEYHRRGLIDTALVAAIATLRALRRRRRRVVRHITARVAP